MKEIIVLTGQTATGKTAHAIKLATEINGELINCDSRQIYKSLDIVTGKDIDTSSLFRVQETVNGQDIGYYEGIEGMSTKIWLYDIITPDKLFSSFDYVKCCLKVIRHIWENGKTPIIVGGTYFYLKHLLYPLPVEGIITNWELRAQLEKKTVEELQTILQKTHQSVWEKMNESDKSNPRRLIRRIEVLSQIEESEFHVSEQKSFDIESKFNLDEKISVKITGFRYADKEKQREQIRSRVEKRLESGAIEETIKLLEKYPHQSPGLKSIGYKQISDFIDKKISKEQLIEDWSNKEYQYAKRQYTFMKKDENISWINIS